MPDDILNRVIIVLVGTSDPGNIGASARAMKTMGIHQLRLVDPLYFPHPKATWRATHAVDLVQQAQVYPDLASAIGDCQLVLATSARCRSLPWPLVQVAEGARLIIDQARTDAPIAIIFGRERAGLTNDELQMCHRHIIIPADEQCGILNISHAVQIVCYEIFRQLHHQENSQNNDERDNHFGVRWDQPLAPHSEIQLMLEALEKTLIASSFYNPERPDKLIPRLRRLFMRAAPDQMEVNIWRGIISHFHSMNEKKKR